MWWGVFNSFFLIQFFLLKKEFCENFFFKKQFAKFLKKNVAWAIVVLLNITLKFELNQTKNCKTKNKMRSLTNQLKYIFELGGEEPLRLLSCSRDFFSNFGKRRSTYIPNWMDQENVKPYVWVLFTQ